MYFEKQTQPHIIDLSIIYDTNHPNIMLSP
jgi:hypothetical protein